jgi:LPS export ABC transporter protein LptC
MAQHARRSLARDAALLAVGTVLAACSREISTPVADHDLLAMEADAVVFGMLSFITTSGVREGRIEADTAYVYDDEESAELRQMKVTFYDENGRERATVTGRTGDWNRATDRMIARGDVELFIHQDSSLIESAEINYDPSVGRLWSDSASVRTDKDGAVTTGSAFESDLTFENIIIHDMRGGARRVF